MLTRHAKAAGADAALIVTPYYNKPTQEGLFQHYRAIHDAVEIPILIYNIPGRCNVDTSVETMARLAALPNIVGVTDPTAYLALPARPPAAIGRGFSQVKGWGATQTPCLDQHGKHGQVGSE